MAGNLRKQVCAVITCIWLSFVMGIVCTLLGLKLKVQTESSLKAVAQFIRQQQELETQIAFPDDSKNSGCTDALCGWHTDHLWRRLNLSVDPCEDFYSFVCSTSWFQGAKLEDQPYAQFSSAQLMADVDSVLSRYLAVAGEESTTWSFIHQAAKFLEVCTNSVRFGFSWEDVKEVLSDFGIAGWPYTTNPKDVDLVSLAGKMERDMGFSPFADVTLYNYSVISGYHVQISPPTTLVRRFILHRNSTALPVAVYEAELRKVFDQFLYDKNDGARLANDIFAFEKHMEAICTVVAVPVNERFVHVRQLGKVSKWDWKKFLAVVFDGVRNQTDDIVICVRCSFFKRLTVVIEQTPPDTLINYIGLRILVTLAPLLPEEHPFLIMLSQKIAGLGGVTERVHSCMNLLERAYHYGTAMIARMSLSRNFLNIYKTHYDREVTRLIQSLTRAVIRRTSKIGWMSGDHERTIAAAKFQTVVHEVFGTAPSLYWPALYYGVSSPRFNDSDALRSYVKLLRHTRRTYLASSSPNLDFDAKYAGSVFVPETAYFHSRSVLFVPQAVVGFLNHVSNTIDSSLIPVVGRTILEGLMRVLDGVGAHIDDKHVLRVWWTANTSSNINALKNCLIGQYATMYWPNADMKQWESYVDINRLLRETALLPPLYDAFVASGPSPMNVKVADNSVLDSSKLFFVNYALSLCDHYRRNDIVRLQRKLRIVPGDVLVNLALMNSNAFSQVYKCDAGSAMNPVRRCVFW
ncbi:neprilysin-1-like [Ornithodoros turicata]|uniref:neprilysin-1-like n=1 Tax=Ornithodoros turicata TaxID=34597 RepID=UPI003139328F